MKTTDPLLTQLLLKHPDATVEEYHEFYRKLIAHRFTRLLHLYDKNGAPVPDEIRLSTLPVEREITFQLRQKQPDLFFKNILYHLRRNKKVVPRAILPVLLSRFKDEPELWEAIYQQHPELTLALARENGDWSYMVRVFQPDITLQLGSLGYYTALRARMRMFPLRTSTYIMQLFPDASPPQQGRLLEILHDDPSPESRQFILSQVSNGRRPVRLAALRSALIRKEEPVYNPIRDALIRWITTGEEVASEGLPASWKDLAELADEETRENILIALTDPEDYQGIQTREFQSRHRSTQRKAAIFHRSQEALYNLTTESSLLLHDTNLIEVMSPKTASKTLLHLAKSKMASFDETYIDLLKRAHPFLSEDGSEVIWDRFVDQWNEMPFTLEELPVELLALRIHPNSIKTIWQHSLLQENSDAISILRETLKYRLAFLKKCYGR